jgi:dolichol-phosphate mannosyltransferase
MKKNKVLIGLAVYNEEQKLSKLLERLQKVAKNPQHFILIINDFSTDNSAMYLKKFAEKHKNIHLIHNKKNNGIGKSIKTIISYGLKHKFDICVIMAGNGKDNPLEIKKLITPIVQKDYDYVQGSRFLKGGSFYNLPLTRKFLINGFTFLVYFFTGYRGTDASNGFRAYKFDIFKDKRIKIHQSWLDRYEFETYLHYKVITLGYKMCEVPVSKDYLPHIKNYSKIRPVIDWWKMARPLIYLKLSIKN